VFLGSPYLLLNSVFRFVHAYNILYSPTLSFANFILDMLFFLNQIYLPSDLFLNKYVMHQDLFLKKAFVSSFFPYCLPIMIELYKLSTHYIGTWRRERGVPLQMRFKEDIPQRKGKKPADHKGGVPEKGKKRKAAGEADERKKKKKRNERDKGDVVEVATETQQEKRQKKRKAGRVAEAEDQERGGPEKQAKKGTPPGTSRVFRMDGKHTTRGRIATTCRCKIYFRNDCSFFYPE
jgi:hypothetical protein